MDDDEIIRRGGTQEDINKIAHDNGACGAIYGGTCDECGETDSCSIGELKKDITDIIEFPQYPEGRVSTRDLRGSAMSSTELGYKVSLIEERIEAYTNSKIVEALSELKKNTVDIKAEMKIPQYPASYPETVRFYKKAVPVQVIDAAIKKYGEKQLTPQEWIEHER